MSKDVTTTRGTEPDEEAEAERESVLSDGYIIDYITGEKHLKDTPKEQVRQFIAQALVLQP
jgi:type I restriction enzyme M protein